MRQDITHLYDFHTSPLGMMMAKQIRTCIEALWPNTGGQSILACGYGVPYLLNFTETAQRVIAVSPAAQGCMRWDETGRGNAMLLSDEMHLPFADAMFDRIILIHSLEESHNPRGLLREIWRVCAPEGRVIIGTANRHGLWARAEHTPLGHGRPFTQKQLRHLLSENMFRPTAWTHAVYLPPSNWPLFVSAADAWERTGRHLASQFGGMVLIEAIKQLYIKPDNAEGYAEKIGIPRIHPAPARDNLLS